MRGSAAFRAAVAPGGVLAGPWVKNELWRRARAVPSLDLRFADNKSLSDAVTGASLVTFTRASSGTYVGSDGLIKTATTDEARFDHNPITGESLGLLVEEQRSNLLLNSGTLSTQSVTVTADAHTLSFTGTGTITLTGTSTAGPLVGTGTGEANRVSLTFTPTAGSLTLTVSGTVTNAQLEIGAFRTSYIATAGAAATRAADVASITGTNFNTAQFARASTATFYNSSGIITTANVDIPRNNYNPTTLVAEGLLLEPQRQNIVLQSNGFDTTWTNLNSTETGSAGTSPDGTNNAWELKDTLDGSAVQHQLVQTGINYEAGKLYTASLHVKAGTLPRVGIIIAGAAMSAGNRSFLFDMTTETFVASGNAINGPSFTKLPNSWYRINMTYIADATDTAGIVIRLFAAGNITGSYQGDGTGTILLYGAQIEEGPDMTSYIPTTTTEVTRSADVPAVSPWYRQDAGSVFSDSSIIASQVQTQVVYGFTGGSFLTSLRQPQLTADQFRAQINGTFSPSPGTGATLSAGTTKAAIAYLNTTGRLQVGSAGSDVSAAGTSDANELAIGGPGGFSAPLNGRVKRLTYWPQRLPNTTLQAITQ